MLDYNLRTLHPYIFEGLHIYSGLKRQFRHFILQGVISFIGLALGLNQSCSQLSVIFSFLSFLLLISPTMWMSFGPILQFSSQTKLIESVPYI